MQHLAEDLDTLVVDVLQEGLDARLNNGLLDLVLDEELDQQAHIPE
jgi:hypothetical protein